MSRKCLQNAELHVTSMFLEGLFKRASLFRKWSSEKKFPIQNTWSIWEKSNIIVDLLQDKQEGITVRTLEGVFYGKKILTNNTKIRQSDLYDPDNIFVLKNANVNELQKFLKKLLQAGVTR